MNELQIFNNPEFGNIRAVEVDGEAWLVGKDVALALDYERPTKAIVDHVDEEDRKMVDGKTQSQFGIELGQRGGWLINESGLYSLVLSSKLPGAKKFKRWVTSDVLPSIRKHGTYITPETLEDMISSPDFGIRLLTEIKLEREKSAALEQKISLDAPLVEFAKTVTESKGAVTVEKFAKMVYDRSGIRMGRNQMFKWLRLKGYLTENNTPYQKYIEFGWFEVCEVVKFGKPYTVTLVTGVGQQKLFEQLNAA